MPPRKRASERLNIHAPAALTRTELREISQDVAELERANERLHARVQVISEPSVYSKASPHSFFRDLAAVTELGAVSDHDEARLRLNRHRDELAVELPRRGEAQDRAAQAGYEAHFTRSAHEQRMIDRFTGAGGKLFERRADSRVDGSGGFFVPPLWLIDEFVSPARAGTEFAALWTQLPLPRGTDEINVPVMKTGTATGTQPADNLPAGYQDVADSFITAVVRTVVGQQDTSAQWLDQGSAAGGTGLDQVIYNDLMADMGLQLDGQLLLGGNGLTAGTTGQLLGVWPAGQISTALAVQMISANNNAAQSWANPGASSASLHADSARLLSGITRARAKHPSHLVTHPWIWDLITSTVDDQHRPLVNIHGPASQPGGAETGPGEDGVLGHVHGLPLVGDANVPTTFGGTGGPGSPYPALGPLSGSQYAAQPGTGSTALYTPVLACRPADMYLWQGEPIIRLLREVLSGQLQVRFQLRAYAAAMPNRYQALSAGTLPNSSGWAAGASTAYGTLTQQTANGILQVVAQGF